MLSLAKYKISILFLNDQHGNIAISDENDQRAFIEEAKTKSDFESPIQTEPGERLITLSTCAYAFENARYILIGRLVPAEQCAADISDTEE